MTTSDSTSPTNSETAAPPPTVWPCLNYLDAPAAIRFIADVLGFEERAAYADPTAPDVIAHAELRWPEGGGVMLGSANRADSEFSKLPTGCASLYVVTDDPRSVHARVVAAGATIVQEMREEDYGSLGFSVRDPEDNIWSFGTYRGE